MSKRRRTIVVICLAVLSVCFGVGALAALGCFYYAPDHGFLMTGAYLSVFSVAFMLSAVSVFRIGRLVPASRFVLLMALILSALELTGERPGWDEMLVFATGGGIILLPLMLATERFTMRGLLGLQAIQPDGPDR